MIMRVIGKEEAGRRLDRYIRKLCPDMPLSFLHKQLRGNGFRVNDKRVHNGDLVLEENDRLAVYLSDEQLKSFGFTDRKEPSEALDQDLLAMVPPIVYEDEMLVIFDKPYGMLSQKDASGRPSLTEIGQTYLYSRGLSRDTGFVPGVCSRLDYNTSGLVLMGKTLKAQQALMQMIREDRIDKLYYALIAGHPDWPEWTTLRHAFHKDQTKNKLILRRAEGDHSQDLVISEVRVLSYNTKEKVSLVEVRLLTGKSHQIRAQLSFEGYPIVGDPKYNPGSDMHHRQLLCARQLHFRSAIAPFEYLQDRRFYAQLPQDMNTYLVDPE